MDVLPIDLQNRLATTYRRALRDAADARGLALNEVRRSESMRRAVLGHALAEMLAADAADAADAFAARLAPISCAREECGNDASYASRGEEWCSRGCQQWARRAHLRGTRRRSTRVDTVAA